MSDPLLVLDHVTVGYPQQPIFEELEFTVAPGQFAAIVGPTGGGKTTLLKTILGLLPCRRGTIVQAAWSDHGLCATARSH